MLHRLPATHCPGQRRRGQRIDCVRRAAYCSDVEDSQVQPACIARVLRFPIPLPSPTLRPQRMKKYWHVFNIGIQNTLVYRANFFFRSAAGLIPLFATLSIWRAVYDSKDGNDVAGYTLAGMVSYYLLVAMIDVLTAVAEDDWQVAGDIKDGNISQFLLKPINYLGYRLTLYASGRIIFTICALVPVGLFVFFNRQHLALPADAGTWALFTVSLVLTALLQFFLSYTVALLAFWVLDVSTFIFIFYSFEYVASGHLFPLDILPAWATKLLHFTPFPYQLFFPVSVGLGRVTGAAVWQGLIVQACWVVAAWLLARFVWSRGVRKYSAVGG